MTINVQIAAGNLTDTPSHPLLPNGVYDGGSWRPDTTYSLGETVTPAVDTIGSSNPAGFRHVEKYNEADFLLLGIPVTFD